MHEQHHNFLQHDEKELREKREVQRKFSDMAFDPSTREALDKLNSVKPGVDIRPEQY